MNPKDILLYADMDGTMLTDWALGPVIPQRNLGALNRFVKDGGAFSIATGRQYVDASAFFGDFTFSAPMVLCNGAYIYDQSEKKFLSYQSLPRSFKEEALEFFLKHDDVWLVASDAEAIYQVMTDTKKDDLLKDTFKRKPWTYEEYLNKEVAKLVFVLQDSKRMPSLKEQVAALKQSSLIEGTQSSAMYLEIMLKGTSKAEGIKQAIEQKNYGGRKLVCIGDYLNDYAMLKMADISACPDTACEEVKEICQIITCSNNDGAVGELIEKLYEL